MLSNAEFIFVYAWSVQSLKGLFQPTKITAAMIAISTKSRRIMCESGRKGRVRAMEIVEAPRSRTPSELKCRIVEGLVGRSLCEHRSSQHTDLNRFGHSETFHFVSAII